MPPSPAIAFHPLPSKHTLLTVCAKRSSLSGRNCGKAKAHHPPSSSIDHLLPCVYRYFGGAKRPRDVLFQRAPSRQISVKFSLRLRRAEGSFSIRLRRAYGRGKIGASLREATSNTRRYAEWTVFGRRLPPLPATSDWQQRQQRAAVAGAGARRAVAAVAAAAAAAATVVGAGGCGAAVRLWDVVACHVHVLSRVCPCMFARLFHAAAPSPMHGRARPRRPGRLILQGIYVFWVSNRPFFLASASRPARPVRSVDT